MLNVATANVGAVASIAKSNGIHTPTTAREWLSGMLDYARIQGCLITVQTGLTPELAEALLERNSNNRSISEGTVHRIAGAIKRGEWKMTHQAIAMSSSGILSDGQHRCRAVLRAAQVVPTLITFGVPDDAFAVIDTGKTRNAADVLHLAGVPSAISAQSVVRNYLTGTFMRDTGFGAAAAYVAITPSGILEFYKANSEHVGVAVRALARARAQFRPAAAGFGAALLEALIIGWPIEKVEEFATLIGSGLGIEDNRHPVYAFRQYFINKDGGTFKPHEQMAVTVKAWTAWVEGRSAGQFRFAKNERFPEMPAAPPL